MSNAAFNVSWNWDAWDCTAPDCQSSWIKGQHWKCWPRSPRWKACSRLHQCDDEHLDPVLAVGDYALVLKRPNRLHSRLLPAKIVSTYCWMQSTFTIVNRLQTEVVGTDVAAPGVVSMRKGDVVQHKYYQWVCFVLFFQGLLFYIPRYLWKMWEAGRMNLI